MLRKIGLIISLLFCFNLILSQSAYYKHFTVEEGLPSNQVYTSHQDSQGYIWFGTDAGLVRYDGFEFKNFNAANSGLCGKLFFEVYESGDFLCFQGERVISLLDKRTNKFTCLFSEYNSEKPESDERLQLDSWNSVFYDSNDSALYFMGKRQVKGQKKFDLVKVKNGNYEIIENPEKVGILTFFHKKFQEAEVVLDGQKKEVPFSFDSHSGSVKSKYLKCDNGYYLYFYNLLLHIDSLNTLKVVRKFPKSIVSIAILDGFLHVVLDPDDGVYRLEGKDVKEVSGLSQFSLTTSVLQDHEGGYWVTTLENGVYYLPSLNVRTILEDFVVKDMVKNGNELVVGTSKASIFRIVTDTAILLRNFDAEFRFVTVDDSGHFIAGVQKLKEPTVNNKLVGTFEVETGRLRYNYCGRRLFYYRNRPNVLHGNGVLSLVEDSVIWSKSNDFTLSTHDYFLKEDTVFLATEKGVWYMTENRQFRLSNLIDPKHSIRTLTYYKGSWLMSVEGRGVFARSVDTLFNIFGENRLKNCYVYQMHNQGDSVLWMATNLGVMCFRDLLEPDFVLINSKDGLASNRVFKVIENRDTIFAATSKGLSYFPKSVSQIHPKPMFRLDSVQVNGINMTLGALNALSHNQNLIRFYFHAISFKSPEDIIYQYKLESDSGWIETSNRFAIFSSLKPGDYNIQFRACDESVKYVSNSETIQISILQPFWKRWWFIIGVFIVIFGLAILIFKSRIRALQKRQILMDELNTVKQESLSSQMNPHFIFNSLNSIQRYILENDPKASNKYLTKFSKLMRQVMENSRKQLIPLQNELEALELYIELEQLRFKGKMTYEIIKNGNTHDLTIPPLLIQPYVENAIWHGLMNKDMPGKLIISVDRKDTYYTITIQDDGVGREKAAQIKSEKRKKYKSAGLDITGKRIELANKLFKGELSLEFFDLMKEDGEPAGTKIIVKIPIN